jgi:hypothetical protein
MKSVIVKTSEGERRVSRRGDRPPGREARGAIRAIDQEIGRLDKRMSGYERLLAERERLLRARAALTGEPSGKGARVKRVSQDEIAAFIEKHPGSLPAQIAAGLGVRVTNVSAHLYRAKGERFERRKDGWHVSSPGGSRAT